MGLGKASAPGSLSLERGSQQDCTRGFLPLLLCRKQQYCPGGGTLPGNSSAKQFPAAHVSPRRDPSNTSLSLEKSVRKGHVHSTSPLPPAPHMSHSHTRLLLFCTTDCLGSGGAAGVPLYLAVLPFGGRDPSQPGTGEQRGVRASPHHTTWSNSPSSSGRPFLHHPSSPGPPLLPDPARRHLPCPARAVRAQLPDPAGHGVGPGGPSCKMPFVACR